MEIGKAGPPYLFRYRSNNLDRLISEITESYIYFPNNEQLNDPYDANYKMLKFSEDENELQKLFYLLFLEADSESKSFIQRKFENKPKDLLELLKKMAPHFIAKYGIACFTLSPINIMTWAMYSSNHEGVCIQYNMQYDEVFFNDIRPIDYVERFTYVDFAPATKPLDFLEIFYKKLKLWENEYELRLLKETSGRHYLNPESIRSIAFGLRCKEDFKNEVISSVHKVHPHIKFYDTKILEDTYGLEFREWISI